MKTKMIYAILALNACACWGQEGLPANWGPMDVRSQQEREEEAAIREEILKKLRRENATEETGTATTDINTASGDTIYFKSGKSFSCKVLSYSNNSFAVSIDGKTKQAPAANVDSIQFSGGITGNKSSNPTTGAVRTERQIPSPAQSASASIDSLYGKKGKTWGLVGCEYSVRTTMPNVKMPIVYLAVCYKKKTGMKYFREMCSLGDRWGRQSETKKSSIELYSRSQTEVPASKVRKNKILSDVSCLYLDAKLIALYAQVWIDGEMVAEKMPFSPAELNAENLPPDWYIKGKYPEKLNY